MKTKITLLTVALCVLFFQTIQAQQTKRMYFIGNSVTDAMNYQGLKSIVQSRGNVDTWSRLMIPGSPLQLLWGARTTGGFTEQPYGNPDNAFTVYSWDILSLQPFDRGIEGAEGDRAMSANFYNLIKTKSPECEVFIYAHWPRTQGNTSQLVATKQQYNDVWLSQTGTETRKFYEDLTAAVRTDYPATATKIRMVPIGEVMYELNNNAAFLTAAGITSIWGIYSDGIHMLPIGSYITSCVMYAMAYHDDPVGLGVPGDFGTIPAAALPYIHQTIKNVIIAKSALTGISYFGPAPVQSLALNASAIELNTTKTATLTPIFTPSNAANKAVTWSSSNGGVASVVNGVVTANAVGTANITVTTTDGGKQSVCAVTVVNSGTAVTGIALNKSTTSILVAANETLTATISPAGATNKNVVWTSSDTNIATVNASGLIVAVKKGVVIISARSVNGLFTATCTVAVTQVNHPPVAVLKYSPGNAGYAPYKVTFDGRSSTDPDPDDFVLGFDWVVKLQGATTNLATQVSNSFDYNFTTAGVYEVTLQAVDNAEQLRSLNTEKVIITVLNLPTVPAAETALCYEGFDYVKSAITNFNGGRGWEKGWLVQDEVGNTMDDFAVDNTSPITVSNLRQSGNYMKLGQGYSNIGRNLDISATGAFKNYLNANGKIGKTGTTLWFSSIIRPQSNNKECSVSFSNDSGWWTQNSNQKVDFGCFNSGFWGFAFGWDAAREYHLSTVPIVDNAPVLLVAKVDFGATNTVTLYINPAPGNAPTGTPVIATTTSNIEFQTLGMAFGVGSNKMGLDEIRFGTSYADVAPLTIPDAAAPTTPTGLAVGTIGSASVVLNWNASVNAVGTTTYDVYQDVTKLGSTTETTYTATGLTASTQYSFTVIAKDGFGSAAATGAVTATTTAPVIDTTAPTIPAGLSAASITSTGFTLNWAASFDAVGVVGYDVYQDASLIASPTTNSYAVTGLTAQTSYIFTVTAKDAKPNVSDASSPLSVTTLATVPVAGGVIATWNLRDSNPTKDMRTTQVPTTTGSNVTVSALKMGAGIAPGNFFSDNALTGTDCTATTLAQAKTLNEYFEFTIAPTAGKSLSVTSIDICAVTQGLVRDFSLLSSLDNYTSQISKITTGVANEVNIVSQNLPVTGHASLSVPVTFRIYIYGLAQGIYSAMGIGLRANAATADLIVNGSVSSAVTGLSKTNANELTLYPNPATDKLSLDFGATVEKADISILDLQGRTLMTQSVVHTQVETLNISSLSNGIYFVKVVNGNKVMNSKFVKK